MKIYHNSRCPVCGKQAERKSCWMHCPRWAALICAGHCFAGCRFLDESISVIRCTYGSPATSGKSIRFAAGNGPNRGESIRPATTEITQIKRETAIFILPVKAEESLPGTERKQHENREKEKRPMAASDS